jgi:hypothetical protein
MNKHFIIFSMLCISTATFCSDSKPGTKSAQAAAKEKRAAMIIATRAEEQAKKERRERGIGPVSSTSDKLNARKKAERAILHAAQFRNSK